MEWWENDRFDQVNETIVIPKDDDVMSYIHGHDSGYASGMDKGHSSGFRRGYSLAKRVHKNDVIKGRAQGAAGMAAAGVAAYGAYKGGKALYKKFKNRNTDKEEKAANESWYNDPGAQQIMESYFSEFADADIYSKAEY